MQKWDSSTCVFALVQHLSGRLICIDYGVVRGWAITCIHLEKHVCVNINVIHFQSNNFLTIKIVNFWDSLQKDPMQKGMLLWILHYSTYDVANQLAKLVSLKKIAHQSWFSKLPWHQTWFGRPDGTMQWRENRIESSCAMKRKRDEFSLHAKGKLFLWCFLYFWWTYLGR